ncbi:MAG: hypothetical protein WB626_08755 [Bacteroidota bacterium]
MRLKRLSGILATTVSAALLWISVKLGDTHQAAAEAPLKLTGVPAGMAFDAPVPQTITFRLRGEGWALAAFLLGSDLSCPVDLGSLPPGPPVLDLGDVVDRIGIPAGVDVLGMIPESVHVGLDTLIRKTVPVELDAAVSFRERYGLVEPLRLTPESVAVEGSRRVLERIRSARTVRARLEDLKEPVDATLSLSRDPGYRVEFTPPEVRLRMDVQLFAEKTIPGLAVEPRGVPPEREVVLVPPRVDLMVRGGVERLGSLTGADFRAHIPYERILSDTSGQLEPVIEPPPGVRVVSIRPERLQYVVRRRL